MRNNKKNIIIHSLVEIKQNKAESNVSKFDYCEELSINERRDKRIKEFIENEDKKEINCTWVNVVHQECKFLVMVKEGQDVETVKKHFIEKRDRIAKNFV